MLVRCEECGKDFDDADRDTGCPHDLIMPAADLEQKKLALTLLEKIVRFAHQPDGPDYRIQYITHNGMVGLHSMVGDFAPHLFVIAKERTDDSR